MRYPRRCTDGVAGAGADTRRGVSAAAQCTASEANNFFLPLLLLLLGLSLLLLTPSLSPCLSPLHPFPDFSPSSIPSPPCVSCLEVRLLVFLPGVGSSVICTRHLISPSSAPEAHLCRVVFWLFVFVIFPTLNRLAKRRLRQAFLRVCLFLLPPEVSTPIFPLARHYLIQPSPSGLV